MKQRYSAERYEDLYNITPGEVEYRDIIAHGSIGAYGCTQTWAGSTLEIPCYPLWCTKAQASSAKQARRKQSPEVIENRNIQTSERKITGLLNENMTTGDLAFTQSFTQAPKNWEEARKAINWMIRELRKLYKALGIELKYLYVYECADKDGKPVRPHFHLFVNAGLTREEIENMWRARYGISNGTRLCETEYGLTGFAKYILKAPRDVKNRRKWAASRNMRKPEQRKTTRLPNGKRLTKRLLSDLQTGRKDARALFEDAYPGYQFIDMRAKTSEYVSGVYVYVRMRKITTTRNKS